MTKHLLASLVLGALAAAAQQGPREPVPLPGPLPGPREVVGTVLDGDGRPLAGYHLLAIPAGRLSPASAEERRAAERDGRLLGASVRTDGLGRFALPGLVPGEYTFHASFLPRLSWRRSSPSENADWLRTTAVGGVRVSEDTPPLVLHGHARRLEIRVLDEQGRPVIATDDEHRHGPTRLPLRVEAADDWHWWWPRAVGDRHVLEVVPDVELVVIWQQDEVPYVERRVRTAFAPECQTVELRLGPQGTPARLDLRVLDPHGRPFEDPIVDVRSEEGRRVAGSIVPGTPGRNLATSSWSVALPPGRFTVTASSRELGGCIVPEELPREPFLPARAEIEVVAGETRSLELRLGPAGHLDLVPLEEDGGPEYGQVVLRSGSRRLEPKFDLPQSSSPVGWLVRSRAARGIDPIPPGRWTLTLESRNGSVHFERDIEIVAGQVTVVRW